MISSLSRLAACVLAVAATGCVSTRAYVENGHDKIDYRELKRRNPPLLVRVVAEFQVNGQPRPEVNNAVFNEVVRVLQQTHVLLPASGNPPLTLKVTVNDVADLDSARRSALVTGLTEGLTGTVTRDDYRFTYLLRSSGGKPQTALYQHAMITVSGSAAPPGHGQPHSLEEAFSIIVKQSVLEFLHDIESYDPETPVMLVPDSEEHK